MQTKSLLLAAALALASTTLANDNTPRIYFPRHVKRQFTNSTITRQDVFPAPDQTPTPTTTKRQGALDGLLGGVGPPILGTAVTEPLDLIPETDVVGPPVKPTDEPELIDDILPDLGILPSTDDDDDDDDEKEDPGGLLLAPTGLVTPTILPDLDVPIIEEEDLTESLPIGLPTGDRTSTASPTDPETTTDVPTETSSEPATITKPPQKTGGLLDPILDPILDPVTPIISTIVDELPPPLNDTVTDLPLNVTDPLTDLPLPTISVDVPILTPGEETTKPTPTVPEPTDKLDPTVTGPIETPLTTVPAGLNGTVTESPAKTPEEKVATYTPTTTFTSVPIVSTLSNIEAWLGTKLAVDTSSPTVNTNIPAPTNGQSLPPDVPSTIDAQDAPVSQPDGTTEIRVAFGWQLRYQYVLKNYTATKQIFGFMPKIISHSQGVQEADITMLNLAYLDTDASLGFSTTVVHAYIPTTIVQTLQLDIKLPSSLVYHNPNPMAQELAGYINPSIEIIPGGDAPGAPGAGVPDPAGREGTPFDGGAQQSKEQTPQQKGASVGIAMGVVGLAAAYGAAMFLVARRYKRRKQSHRRASSTVNSSEMRYSGSGNPPMMGGALLSQDFSSYGGVTGARNSQGSGRTGRSTGNSGRTAFISAPVAAENSLGWN